MSSGGSRETTTTTNSGPPAWAIPYFQQGIGLASDVATKPYDPYTGQLVAGMNRDQTTGANMIRQQAGDTSMLDAGQNFATGLLGGQGQYQQQRNPFEGAANPYAGSNQYLDGMIGAANRDITDAYTRSTVPSMLSQFQGGGAFGGTAMQEALSQSQQNLGRQLSDTSNQFRFQDYTTQQGLAEASLNRNAQLADSRLGRGQQAWDSYQGRQMNALGQLPNLYQSGFMGGQNLMNIGQQQQLNQQAQLDANYGQYMDARDWDQNRLQSLLQGLGTIQGGSTSATGANPNYRSAGQNALTAAAVVAAFMSDENSKTDKKPMDAESGLLAIRKMPIEKWRYHGDTEQHAGTYSQDFYKALGMEPKPAINSMDMFGALGGAIKALDKKVNKRASA